jgi:hypothetical protein
MALDGMIDTIEPVRIYKNRYSYGNLMIPEHVSIAEAIILATESLHYASQPR